MVTNINCKMELFAHAVRAMGFNVLHALMDL